MAKNITAMESGKSMRSYKPGTRILLISLGPKRYECSAALLWCRASQIETLLTRHTLFCVRRALLVRGDRVVLENGLAARIKSAVEYKTMKAF